MDKQRTITYSEAVNEALRQAMGLDHNVFVFGLGVDTPPGVFKTTIGLKDEFSGKRVFDTPASESSMTGVALGAGLAGMRPVLVHQRLDFMLYSMDQLVNWAALWRYKSGGRSSMPFTIRAVVGKGWGQGPQHSKSLQSWFAHVPGIRVAMPSTPFDAKGLLMNSIFGEDPTIIVEGRELFNMWQVVPEEPYKVPFGKALQRRKGTDVTLVSLGSMVPLALQAADKLEEHGINTEVLDMRTVAPLDEAAILESVAKTGRLVIADPAWKSFGVSAEISARVSESAFKDLKAPIARVAYPNVHSPTSVALEALFYPDENVIVNAVKSIVKQG